MYTVQIVYWMLYSVWYGGHVSIIKFIIINRQKHHPLTMLGHTFINHILVCLVFPSTTTRSII